MLIVVYLGMMESVKQPLSFLNRDFHRESDMVDYIENNIHLFCSQCLGIAYKSHIREYPLESHKRKGKRIDLLIEAANGDHIIVECKNPKYICELHNAVGQILNYSMLLNKWMGYRAKRLVIVSSKFDTELIETVDMYSLPITLVGLDKKHHLLHDISHLN